MTAQQKRLVGPHAAVRKYDVLTAISLASLRGGTLTPTQALRLIALVTAYYDWTRDQVAVGQAALMELWGVSRRTVIRDVAAFRALGLLRLIATARRGRVAVHRLDHAALEAIGADHWACAGTAFAKRMTPRATAAGGGEGEGAPEARARPSPAACADAPVWAEIKTRLEAELNPAAQARWIEPLSIESEKGGVLRLTAPTQFHASYVERTHGDRIAAAAAWAFGRPVRVTFAEAR